LKPILIYSQASTLSIDFFFVGVPEYECKAIGATLLLGRLEKQIHLLGIGIGTLS
jgi:hypothetical protein